MGEEKRGPGRSRRKGNCGQDVLYKRRIHNSKKNSTSDVGVPYIEHRR